MGKVCSRFQAVISILILFLSAVNFNLFIGFGSGCVRGFEFITGLNCVPTGSDYTFWTRIHFKLAAHTLEQLNNSSLPAGRR